MPNEGFWHDKYERKNDGLPMPVANKNPWGNQQFFLEVLNRVEKGIRITPDMCYRGYSECRICKCVNGSMEYQLDEWIWPEGFRHYVDRHNVKPSNEFIAFILSKGT
jgi:hypothetical protein